MPPQDDGATRPADDTGPASTSAARSIIDEWVDSINRDLDARNTSLLTRVRRSITPRRALVAAVLVALIVGAWFVSIGLAVAIAVVVALTMFSAIITRPRPDIAVHGLGPSRYEDDHAADTAHVMRVDGWWGGGGSTGSG